MKSEFKRFGLEKLRIFTGVVEIAGGLAMLIGIYWKPLLILSASGFSLLMISALITRLKVKDSIKQALPALSLLVMNLWILYSILSGV